MPQSQCILMSYTSGTSLHRCATSGFVYRDTDKLERGSLSAAVTSQSVICSVSPSATPGIMPPQSALTHISLIDAKTAIPLHGAEVCSIQPAVPR